AEVRRLRSRRAGRTVFIEFALVVPGSLPVREAHQLCDRMEEAVQRTVPQASVTVHVEPAEKGEEARMADAVRPLGPRG
ncbi:cation transporter dimerization domain-containing protein, partial [Methylacidimicrobium tartarophylax]